MRELKFRVWDKLGERFTTCDEGYQGHYVLSLKGEFHNLQNGSGGKEYIVQQYTGMKDRNGRDVYEGDIVKLIEEGVGFFLNELPKYTAGEILMLVGNWKVCQKYFGATRIESFYCCDDCPLCLEVIGNIFENPELLK